MAVWAVLLVLLAAYAQSEQLTIDPLDVMAPRFQPTAPLVTDLTNSSLVQQPSIASIRDTSIVISWVFDGTASGAGFPSSFQIELVQGRICQDFQFLQQIDASEASPLAGGGYTASATISSLVPLEVYRTRVIPVFGSGPGFPSNPLTFTTLSAPQNYWEPIIPRRSSEATYRRGFSDPVLARPHLTPGVEVLGERVHNLTTNQTDITSSTSLWYSDPVTSEAHEFPSGRRGSSLTLIEGAVYMFGGRTNGYSCASVLKDTINLGQSNSGVQVYPCVSMQAEVSEIWHFDLDSYTWKYLNTSKYQQTSSPPPREQHSAVSLAGDLFVFGGKSRLHEVGANGRPVMNNASDKVHGDLWRLHLQHPLPYAFHYLNTTSSVNIQQTEPLQATITAQMNGSRNAHVTPREGYCIKDMTVTVTFSHPCLTQMRISLLGPGPLTGSPNFFPPADGQEVLLLANVAVNATSCVGGQHTMVFNDANLRNPSDCCATEFNGPYKPSGKLAEFVGSSMLADWTLVVQDMKDDQLGGQLHAWHIDFIAAPCYPTYTWTNMTSTSMPSARYASQAVAYEQSLFIYGGRDAADLPLADLHRYDTLTKHWTALTPVGFDQPMVPSTTVGYSLALTAWGLLRFGGYVRQPSMTISPLYPQGGIFSNTVMLMDPVTQRWSEVAVNVDFTDNLFGERLPHARYLASMVFLPASAMRWRSQLPERMLFDQPKRSYQVNYQGTVADTLMVFGGFDGTTGAAVDGSLGGYYNDIWMLRMNQLSTADRHSEQQAYAHKHCQWRTSPSAQAAGTVSCLRTGSGGGMSSCRYRDLLMLPWCAKTNQTMR